MKKIEVGYLKGYIEGAKCLENIPNLEVKPRSTEGNIIMSDCIEEEGYGDWLYGVDFVAPGGDR